LSLGSNDLASVLFADPPGPRQPSFEAGHQGLCPAGYTARPPEERSVRAAFPSPFGTPALACWTILFPPRSSASLTVGLPATATGRTSTGLPRCPRVRPDRGGRLLDPGAVVSTRQEGNVPAGTRRFAAASPTPQPQRATRRGSAVTRHQRRFTLFARPIFLSPVAPEMAPGALRLSPGLRTPPLPATHARARTGPWTLA